MTASPAARAASRGRRGRPHTRPPGRRRRSGAMHASWRPPGARVVSSLRIPESRGSAEGRITLAPGGRHDACIALRAAVVLEAACAVALADLSLAARAAGDAVIAARRARAASSSTVEEARDPQGPSGYIDRIDARLLSLIDERMEKALLARSLKSTVSDPAREKAVLEQDRALLALPCGPGLHRGRLLEEGSMSEASAIQERRPKTISFQGERRRQQRGRRARMGPVRGGHALPRAFPTSSTTSATASSTSASCPSRTASAASSAPSTRS